MKIKYYAYLREEAGCKEESLSGSFTALSLLRFLGEKHGPGLSRHLLSPEGDEIHADLIFLLDGRHIEFLNNKETIIPENSIVSLFPRIAGG